MALIENYKKHTQERATLGVPPLPLNAAQVAELVTLLKADKRKRVTLPKDARHRKYRAHVMNNGTVVLVPVISPNNSAPPSGPEPKAARSWLV